VEEEIICEKYSYKAEDNPLDSFASSLVSLTSRIKVDRCLGFAFSAGDVRHTHGAIVVPIFIAHKVFPETHGGVVCG
jgi:hypothetical protein